LNSSEPLDLQRPLAQASFCQTAPITTFELSIESSREGIISHSRTEVRNVNSNHGRRLENVGAILSAGLCMFQVFTCLTTQHDWRLVVLAGFVCLLSSSCGISLFYRAQATFGRTRLLWVGLDAAAAGCGIWATHFIAMLAYDPGTSTGYDPGWTTVSLILAVAITGVGLSVALSNFSRWSGTIGGAVIGGGIAAMHFTGMLALEVPGHISWSLELILASLFLGVLFGCLAFLIATRRDGRSDYWFATIALTLATVSHHFTAMGAVSVIPDPRIVTDPLSLSPTSLSLVVAGVATIILGMSLVASLSARQSQDKLGQQRILLDTALENMSQGLAMFDENGRVILCNERYARMTGVPFADVQGQSLLDLFKFRKTAGDFTDDPQEVFSRILADVGLGKSAMRIMQTLKGRSIRVIEEPMTGGGWVATLEDITAWREAQEKLAYLAHHDPLTGLPNRTKFREELEQTLRRVNRDGRLAVLCLDLDHFKEINDSLGHPIGDALLKEVASRLSISVREGDTVGRLGGDEFAIVQAGTDLQASESSSLADRLVAIIGAPYAIHGHQLNIGVSIGIAFAPNDGDDPDQLLKNADMALYRAKEDGRGIYRFFETGMDARAQARRILEIDLRAALTRDEFEVHYQPIHELKTDQITAFEALVRWKHPLRGMISPMDFIPLAEETGLINQLGDWVLRRACMDAASWSRDVRVAVNLSPVQFKNPNLVQAVMSALTACGLAPERLELEITESVLLQDSAATLAILHKLRSFGVQISMDDFGTGYSSLSYLRSFPFDKIKIDRSFVHELATREDSMAIVRAVTGLGKSLGISIVAEGVETNEQLGLLRTEGCTEVQGFLFSRPRPAEDVETMLSYGRERGAA
jgi:diguanylate cyclase (GGDEF)-like protein/PAS domain S-box-containing protein